MCMSNSSNYSESKRRKTAMFTLNLMSDTPKKPGKKGGRKARQGEALDVYQICRINLELMLQCFASFDGVMFFHNHFCRDNDSILV